MIVTDHFTPFFGVVENDNDEEEKAGRVKVRVHVYNSDAGILPTEDLLWFHVGVNNSTFLNGKGESPTSYKNGTLVFGYYIDEHRMEGIIITAFGNSNDVSPIAKGESDERIEGDRNSTIEFNDVWENTQTEPKPGYSTTYPNNKVYDSPSGHLQEFDDTEGEERIHTRHTSGTKQEFQKDGKLVTKVKNDRYSIIEGDDVLYIKGKINIVVEGDVGILCNSAKVKAKSNIDVECDNVNVIASSSKIECPNNEITGNLKVGGNVEISGTSKASDHISGTISGKKHKHTETQSTTTPPIA